MAGHRYADGQADRLHRRMQGLVCLQELSAPVDVANALLQLLLDRHPAITAEVAISNPLTSHDIICPSLCRMAAIGSC